MLLSPNKKDSSKPPSVLNFQVDFSLPTLSLSSSSLRLTYSFPSLLMEYNVYAYYVTVLQTIKLQVLYEQNGGTSNAILLQREFRSFACQTLLAP